MKTGASKPIVCMAGQKPMKSVNAKCRKGACAKCGHNYSVCVGRAIYILKNGLTVGPDGLQRLIIPKP